MYTKPTVEDWKEWADQLWIWYTCNSAAQAAIPAEYLSLAYQTPASHGEVAVNQEEDGAGPDENTSLGFVAVAGLLFSIHCLFASLYEEKLKGTP